MTPEERAQQIEIQKGAITTTSQPEKEWWEEEFEQNWGWIRPLTLKLSMKDTMRRIAAQSEKKGRELAVGYIMQRSDESMMNDEQIKAFAHLLEAAISSEEGKM